MARNRNENNIILEDAQVLFRNFAGREGQFNREGDRNFCVLLEPDLADHMAQDGWNIKTLKVREPGDEPQPYIQVSIGFKIYPPTIAMITSGGRRRSTLSEDMVELLDWVDIEKVDLVIRPYEWGPISGKSGIKAYLKSFFVTIYEDPLQLKYQDIPEIGAPDPLEIMPPEEDDRRVISGRVIRGELEL